MNRSTPHAAKTRLFLLSVTVLSALGSQCMATTFSFDRITNNGIDNPEAQFSVNVSESAGRVLFKLSNAGPFASNVTEVYWDDDSGLLSNGPDVDDGTTSPGVAFLPNASVNPGNLPGGNAVSFAADHAIDSQNGNGNGVQPSEMAGFLFDGNTNAVIAAMHSGSLRVGMHVRSIGSAGESEGFVNIPEPSTGLLLGLAILASVCRRCS